MTLIQGAYGIQITATGGGSSGIGSVSMNFDVSKSASVSSQVTINGATITPSTVIKGPIAKFEQTHAVKDNTGKSASVYVKVVNAPNGLTYGSKVLPKEGNVATQTKVSAEQWLTVPKANSIKCTATASYGTTRSAKVGLEEYNFNPQIAGDYVTLTGYYGKAVTTGTSVSASQTATSGSALSIKIYDSAKDSSGTYSVNTLLNGISSKKAKFSGLSETSSAGTATQVVQTEHLNGDFTSTATYKPVTGTTKAITRTSNYGMDYDLNMKAAKGSLPTGIQGYYVKPGTTASKIQGAVNAAQSGDTINVATGTYVEDVDIKKELTLKGSGNPTATSFTLNAILGTGSGGITAPIVNVNPVARIQDGVTLASSGGTVNVAAGTYKENVIIDQSLTVKGAGSAKTIVDGNKAGSVFSIGTVNPNVNVALSGMRIQDGSASGGGIYNNAKLIVTDSTISENSGYGISNSNVAMVLGCKISKNNGYGINNGNEGIITIVNNDLSSNGGGISNQGIALIANSKITGNSVDNRGGGIYNSGTAWLTGSTVSGNSATNDGGGIWNSGIATVSGSTISGNHAKNGAGIYNSNTFTMNDGTVSSNNAEDAIGPSYGGGIYNSGTFTMNNGTVSSNSAGGPMGSSYGGGIYNSGTFTMNDGTVSGNSAGGGILATVAAYTTLAPSQ